jgi:competence protein ComEA
MLCFFFVLDRFYTEKQLLTLCAPEAVFFEKEEPMKKLLVILFFLAFAAWQVLGTSLGELTADRTAAVPRVEEPQPSDLYVYITGAVRKPGLYTFAKDVTVGEAVQAAGEALPYASADAVNFAARVHDGMHVHIPYNLDGIPAGAAVDDGTININEADAKKLAELPGVGPAMAEQILTYREEHGSFTSIEELQQVKGIGQAKYDKLKDKVSV